MKVCNINSNINVIPQRLAFCASSDKPIAKESKSADFNRQKANLFKILIPLITGTGLVTALLLKHSAKEVAAQAEKIAAKALNSKV